jgi:DNA-directed RNA polymerase specialized sigma24 family protein
MTSDGSITRWIGQLRGGDGDAAEQLWRAYFARMVEHAGRLLNNSPKRSGDEEDAALSAFKSFCLGARAGRFPQLADRDNLWPLLVALTSHKCVDLIRHDTRKKRGGPTGPGTFEDVVAKEPTPEFVVQLADELDTLLGRLDAAGDPTLRSIALWKLEGLTTPEIAERLGCVRRTVERKLALIARLWEAAGP